MADLRHDDVHFEPTDAAPGPIVWFLVILMAATGGLMLILWWAQDYLIVREEHIRPAVSALARDPRREPLPEVRIEGMGKPTSRTGDMGPPTHSTNRTDLPTSAATLRQDEEQQLRDGWTDSAGGKHPPIEEAIRRIIAKHGAKP